MRVSVLRSHGRLLARGAAVLLVCGTAAGCSSTMSRFTDLDSIFTSSTSKEANALPASQQPYPAPIAPAPTSAIQRSSLAAPNAARTAQAETARASETATAAPKQVAAAKVPLPSQPPSERIASAEKPKPAPVKPAKPETVASAKPLKPGDGYVVATGDSWNKVAQKTGIAVAELKAANPASVEGLQIGQKLVLPKHGAAKPVAQQVAAAKPAPALDAMPTAATKVEAKPVAYTPPQPASKVLAEAESSKDEAPDASGVGKMRWPVRGRVVARYGAKGPQASDGIDIAVPEGTPVKAAENGVVIYAGDGLKEFGNTVLVRHENGLVTVYGHASQLKVTRGEKVTRGQDIALSGMSGTTDTPKLHFEVRKNSAPVDPSTFLQ